MQRKRIKLCNDNNFFSKIPREIQILILLNTKIAVVNIIQTCKHFYSFININNTYDKIWCLLTKYMLDCKLTENEYFVKQIYSYERFSIMMLMKCAVTLMEPIIILLGKNNMPVSDLLIYGSLAKCIVFRCVHKNQIKLTWKPDGKLSKVLERFNFYAKLLVNDNKILNYSGCTADAVFYFNDMPNKWRIAVDLFSPHNPSDANFRIKI